MMRRRQILTGGAALAFSLVASGGYALGLEPARLAVTEYAPKLSSWPEDLSLTVAVLADIHAVAPYMTADRIQGICRVANGLRPDLVLLAGDYVRGFRRLGWPMADVPMTDCAAALGTLDAPLGIYAVLGNHDMWANGAHDVRTAFATRGLPILENQAVRLTKDRRPFWLLGLGDQLAYPTGRGGFRGADDLPATLAAVRDDAPAILLAHEPDIFPAVPDRIALTISGHTHGGQVWLPFCGPPIVPSRYGRRYAYGHVVEDGRHLIVSGGLGMSVLPIRFGVTPEIVLIRLGGRPSA